MTKSNIIAIAACSTNDEGGIYRYRLNADGSMEKIGFNFLHDANYLTQSGDMLYSTGTVNGKTAIAAYRISGETKELEELSVNTRCEDGAFCHLVTTPDGKRLYAAAYAAGYFAEYRLNADGSLVDEAPRCIYHYGTGPNKVRQESAHPHFCGITPDGRYVLVIDLTLDAIFSYPYDSGNGVDAENPIINRITTPGGGSRHLVFTADGKTAYLANEMGNSIEHMSYHDGVFTRLATRTTLPRGVNCATKVAAVRLSADEKYLLVTNRGYDSTAVFALADDGTPEMVSLALSGGSSPRDINFLTADDRYIGATNEFSDNVLFFDFDRKTGVMTPNGYRIDGLPRPLYISVID